MTVQSNDSKGNFMTPWQSTRKLIPLLVPITGVHISSMWDKVSQEDSMSMLFIKRKPLRDSSKKWSSDLSAENHSILVTHRLDVPFVKFLGGNTQSAGTQVTQYLLNT